jgi:hypothetical protein
MSAEKICSETEKTVVAAVNNVFAERVPLEYRYLAEKIVEVVLLALRGETARH